MNPKPTFIRNHDIMQNHQHTEAMNTDRSTCRECGRTFRIPSQKHREPIPQLCQLCESAAMKRIKFDPIAVVLESVDAVTPLRFRMTDVEHPQFRRDLWPLVKDCNPTESKPGIGIIGPPGIGKTRFALLLLRRWAVEMIRPGSSSYDLPGIPRVEVVTASDLSDRFEEIGKSAASNPMRVLQDIESADILLIDDLGKVRNLSSAEISSRLFTLLDRRYAANRVTIWTSNIEPEDLALELSEAFAAALVFRLRESSSITTFSDD